MQNVSSSNSQAVNVPKLRFPGFESEWETSCIGNFGSFYKGAPLSKADISDNGIPFVLYGELYTTYNEVATEIIRKTEATVGDEYISESGDVIIPTSGETAEDIATATCIMKPGVILAGDLCIMRPNKIDGRFLSYIINHKAKYAIARIAQGKSVVHIRPDEVEQIKVSYPSKSEQDKILCFLGLLSQKIEKQQQLIDSLKLYKRGLINNLFDRKIKTTGTWKKYALSEVLTERKTYCEKDGTYEHATLSKDGVYGKTERYDRDFLVSSDDKKYKITKEGDLCYNPANLKFGVICLNTYGDAIFSPIYVTFEIATKFDKHFIAACVTRNDFVNAALRFQQGTVYERMAVSPEDLLSMKIELPEMSVQKHFSNIFQKLDLLIAVHEKQFESMVAQKRTLLQQMFI